MVSVYVYYTYLFYKICNLDLNFNTTLEKKTNPCLPDNAVTELKYQCHQQLERIHTI